jgi:hypothetical protein
MQADSADVRDVPVIPGVIVAVASRGDLAVLTVLAILGRRRHSAGRAASVPMIVLLIGPLWVLGLFCGEQRRAYVIKLTKYAMKAVHALLHGQSGMP